MGFDKALIRTSISVYDVPIITLHIEDYSVSAEFHTLVRLSDVNISSIAFQRIDLLAFRSFDSSGRLFIVITITDTASTNKNTMLIVMTRFALKSTWSSTGFAIRRAHYTFLISSVKVMVGWTDTVVVGKNESVFAPITNTQTSAIFAKGYCATLTFVRVFVQKFVLALITGSTLSHGSAVSASLQSAWLTLIDLDIENSGTCASEILLTLVIPQESRLVALETAELNGASVTRVVRCVVEAV